MKGHSSKYQYLHCFGMSPSHPLSPSSGATASPALSYWNNELQLTDQSTLSYFIKTQMATEKRNIRRSNGRIQIRSNTKDPRSKMHVCMHVCMHICQNKRSKIQDPRSNTHFSFFPITNTLISLLTRRSSFSIPLSNLHVVLLGIWRDVNT